MDSKSFKILVTIVVISLIAFGIQKITENKRAILAVQTSLDDKNAK